MLKGGTEALPLIKQHEAQQATIAAEQAAARAAQPSGYDAGYHANIESTLNAELERNGTLASFNQQIEEKGHVTLTKSDGTEMHLNREQAINAAHILGARGFAEAVGGKESRLATLEKYAGRTIEVEGNSFSYEVSAGPAPAAVVETPQATVAPIEPLARLEPKPISSLNNEVLLNIQQVSDNFDKVIQEAAATDIATTGVTVEGQSQTAETENALEDLLGSTPPPATEEPQQTTQTTSANEGNDLEELLGGTAPAAEAQQPPGQSQTSSPETPQQPDAVAPAEAGLVWNQEQAQSYDKALEAMSQNKDFKQRHFRRAEETAHAMGPEAFLQSVEAVNADKAKARDIEWADKEQYTDQEKSAYKEQDRLIHKAGDFIKDEGKKRVEDMKDGGIQEAGKKAREVLEGIFGSVEIQNATSIVPTSTESLGQSGRGIV